MAYSQSSSEKLLKVSLGLLITLNIFDAGLTLYWIQNNIAAEGNPIMHAWIQISPDLFIFMKIFLVTVGVLLLWICRKHRLAYWAGLFLLSLYSAIMLVHGYIAIRVLSFC